MRRLLPKPKERRKVPVPAELRDALREVSEMIEAAKNDPDIQLDFDDAIQNEVVCGGRYGTKPRPYVLTYYPAGDSDRGRWFLALSRSEIEDIGDGVLPELMMYCCTSSECRCKFRQEDEHCFYCDYVEDQNFGHFDFPEAEAKLFQRGVNGITKQTGRAQVVQLLGSPDLSGGGDLPTGFVWPWIKYHRDDCEIHFEFNKTQNWIRAVTIQPKNRR